MEASAHQQQDQNAARIALARELKALLAAPQGDLPFSGSYLSFHEFFGDRLVVEIDPGSVTHQFPPNRMIGGRNVSIADYVLGRGSWDGFLEPLDRSVIHREVADVLASGDAFRDTESHAALRERLERGNPAIRNMLPLDSAEKIDRYFEDMLALVASIRSKGYRRRPRYNGVDSAEAAMAATTPLRPLLVELTESEIGMAVDAGGRLVRVGPGNHRMAIARQLGLARVPVEMRLFHVAWVRRAMESAPGPLHAIGQGVRALSAGRAGP